jgi:hypothetical protein
MMALRVRWCGVMSSDVLIDYLLDDGSEVSADLRLELGRESLPDGGGIDSHNTSYSMARVTSSLTAAAVSLVFVLAGAGMRLVAATGICNSISCR